LITVISAMTSTSMSKRLVFSGKYQARQDPVAEGVLLPVDEMLLRLDAQRIAQDGRARVRRRAQAQDVRRHVHGLVVTVVGLMADGDADGHGNGKPHS
jgi:hypothetical protein